MRDTNELKKKIMKIKSLKFVGIIAMLFLMSGCDLPLQENYKFAPEAVLGNPYEKVTAWDFLLSLKPSTGKTAAPYYVLDFEYLIAAIKKADMIEEFNQVATKERTYLLLDNQAFVGANNVIQIVTGSATVPTGQTAEQTMDRVNTPARLEKLRTLLRYHIITTYILQTNPLVTVDTDYIFQTLIPGNDGLIALRRGSVWEIYVNQIGSPMPKTATDENEAVFHHNFQFVNGIGHVLRDPVRNKPY